MKRRTLLGGLGVLATGSGAISTAASLTDTVDASADIRVINPQDMKLRPGVAFRDNGSVRETDGFGPTESDSDYNYSEYYTENTTFFEEEDPSNPEGLKNISQSDVPVATVNRRDKNIDGDIEIQTAISLDKWDGNPFYFENILEVENRSGGQQNVAIKYENNYGSDINVNSSQPQEDIIRDDVQSIYKFWVKKQTTTYHISPEPLSTNVEEPAESAPLLAGETVQLDLEIDLGTYGTRFTTYDPKQGIKNAQEGLGFGGGVDTVNLLDAIKIGKFS